MAPGAGSRGAAVLEQAKEAFVHGLSVSLLVGAGVLFAASALVALLAPRREAVPPARPVERGIRPEGLGEGSRS